MMNPNFVDEKLISVVDLSCGGQYQEHANGGIRRIKPFSGSIVINRSSVRVKRFIEKLCYNTWEDKMLKDAGRKTQLFGTSYLVSWTLKWDDNL